MRILAISFTIFQCIAALPSMPNSISTLKHSTELFKSIVAETRIGLNGTTAAYRGQVKNYTRTLTIAGEDSTHYISIEDFTHRGKQHNETYPVHFVFRPLVPHPTHHFVWNISIHEVGNSSHGYRVAVRDSSLLKDMRVDYTVKHYLDDVKADLDYLLTHHANISHHTEVLIPSKHHAHHNKTLEPRRDYPDWTTRPNGQPPCPGWPAKTRFNQTHWQEWHFHCMCYKYGELDPDCETPYHYGWGNGQYDGEQGGTKCLKPTWWGCKEIEKPHNIQSQQNCGVSETGQIICYR